MPGRTPSTRVSSSKVRERPEDPSPYLFLYLYDFGDGWEHEIVVEGVVTPDPTVQYPWCLTGERACPPEDCGGPPGFERFREAVEDPTHDDHGHMLSWVGGSYDAEAFDREKVNATLRRMR